MGRSGVTYERLSKWLNDSEPGDEIQYMVADYAGRKPRIQRLFMRAAQDGKVFLYQKRAEEGRFEYHARRISRRAGKRLAPWRLE
jgi:hypothetical protein